MTAGELDAFTFRGITGDTVELSATAVSTSGSLILEVQALDGSTALSSSVRIRMPCLSRAGTYQIVVHALGLYQDLPYNLSFFQSSALPPSGGLVQYLAIYRCGG